MSPVLANVFLHYVLDIGFEKVVQRHGRGEACRRRYADDVVCAFADQAEAERFYNVLGRRLEKFGLELSGAKTRIIPFSRYRQGGKRRFEFLGCEFRWGKDRKGQDHQKRREAPSFTAGMDRRWARRAQSLGSDSSKLASAFAAVLLSLA